MASHAQLWIWNFWRIFIAPAGMARRIHPKHIFQSNTNENGHGVLYEMTNAFICLKNDVKLLFLVLIELLSKWKKKLSQSMVRNILVWTCITFKRDREIGNFHFNRHATLKQHTQWTRNRDFGERSIDRHQNVEEEKRNTTLWAHIYIVWAVGN